MIVNVRPGTRPSRQGKKPRHIYMPRSPASVFPITLKSNRVQPNQSKSRLVKIFFVTPTSQHRVCCTPSSMARPATGLSRRGKKSAPIMPRSPASPFPITLKSNKAQPNQGKSRLIKIFFMTRRGNIAPAARDRQCPARNRAVAPGQNIRANYATFPFIGFFDNVKIEQSPTQSK